MGEKKRLLWTQIIEFEHLMKWKILMSTFSTVLMAGLELLKRLKSVHACKVTTLLLSGQRSYNGLGCIVIVHSPKNISFCYRFSHQYCRSNSSICCSILRYNRKFTMPDWSQKHSRNTVSVCFSRLLNQLITTLPNICWTDHVKFRNHKIQTKQGCNYINTSQHYLQKRCRIYVKIYSCNQW